MAGHYNGWVYVAAMVLSGTLNTVFSKTQYDVRSRGTEMCLEPTDLTRQTDLCLFDKPWYSSLLARIGMALPLVCLHARHAVWWWGNKRGHVVPNETSRLLPHNRATRPRLTWQSTSVIAGLAVLDQLQTLLANVGLLWVSSSVYQMARGSVVIFSALISMQFLRIRLHSYHIVSLAIVSLAVVLVSWSGMPDEAKDGGESTGPALLGLSLVVLAQFITAVQIASEEYLMTERLVDPVVLVGAEGLWGLFFYVFLIPVLTFSPSSPSSAMSKIWHEDFYDSFLKITNSKAQIALSLLNIASVAVLGPSSNFVTKHLSTVVRSIAEVLRTLGVWVAGLLVWYVFDWRGSNSPGEAWTTNSWIELLGFVLMIYGTLTYKRIILLPSAMLYTHASLDEEAEAEERRKTCRSLTT